MRRRVAALACLVAAGWPAGAAGDRPAPGQPGAAARLYVCVQDEARIAVLDAASRAVVKTIDLQALGFPATAKPHYVVAEPSGSHWYVSLIGAGRVVKFDAHDAIVGQFEMETPGMLALAGANRLLVSRSMSAVNPPKRVALVDRATMRGDEVDVLFPRPHPVAVSPGGFGYTGSLGVNQIASIALGDDQVTIVDVAGPTHSIVQFAVSPDGRTLVGTAELSGQLLVWDLAEPARPRLVTTVAAGKMAFDPVFAPDGRSVWVPVKSTNEVVVFSSATWTETARFTAPAFRAPHQIVFSLDGRTAFVTNNNKMDHMADPAHAGHERAAAGSPGGPASLAVVDTASRRVVQTIELGRNLTGMGLRRER